MIDFLDDMDENIAALYKFADDGSVKISTNTTAECLVQLEELFLIMKNRRLAIDAGFNTGVEIVFQRQLGCILN